MTTYWDFSDPSFVRGLLVTVSGATGYHGYSIVYRRQQLLTISPAKHDLLSGVTPEIHQELRRLKN